MGTLPLSQIFDVIVTDHYNQEQALISHRNIRIKLTRTHLILFLAECIN